MSMDRRHEIGRQAEARVASWYLKVRKATLLGRNYRTRLGEIDLIFEEKSPKSGETELVFVEVRVRLDGNWRNGLESVDPTKMGRLIHTARCFLACYHGPSSGVRFDLVSWDGKRWDYFPNLRIDRLTS